MTLERRPLGYGEAVYLTAGEWRSAKDEPVYGSGGRIIGSIGVIWRGLPGEGVGSLTTREPWQGSCHPSK